MKSTASVLVSIVIVLFTITGCKGASNTTTDTTAPSVAITVPVDGTTQAQGMIIISGTASDDTNLTAVQISIDGSAETNVTGLGSWRYSWDASGASSGTHTVVVTARDSAANESYAQISITLSALGLTRWQWSQIEYAGGFRVMGGKVGEGDNSILAFSPGVFTIDETNNTLYMVTHAYEQGFGEINLPQLTLSEDIHDFMQADTVIQPFQAIYGTDRDVTGIEGYFRVTGLYKMNNQLIVNYMNWYDAPGTETDTTMIFKDASNLKQSKLIGPFQLEGKAHAGGWISPIPGEWQSKLGGTHISGMSQGSIVSRLSVGPSAFVWTPENELLSASTGAPLKTITALDYSLQHILYDTGIFNQQADGTDNILYNRVDGKKNNLWTIISAAAYGFIIPGTSTYMVVGYSGGHESGLGYKITQDTGRLCGGPCSYVASDNYNYYWLYDVNDLVSVVQGEIEPWEVRPYDYGIFDTIGNTSRLTGAYYDADDDLLYIALKNGDLIPTYDKPPLFLAYHLHPRP